VGVSPEERPILTHCQVLGADLVERMARMNVVANVQPSFVPTDMRWVQERLSVEKQRYAYVWKTLMSHGVHVAGGSDAPIETSSPLIGMRDAIFRSSKSGDEVYKPEECLTFAEALWMYTREAAYAAGCENDLGSIQNGYAADFILIDPEIMTDPKLLGSVSPDLVCVGGRVTHASNTLFAEYYEEGQKSSLSDTATALCQTAGVFSPGKNGGRAKKWEKAFTIRSKTIVPTTAAGDESISSGCGCCGGSLWS